MATSNEIKEAAEQSQPEQTTMRILELLDKLAAAESLAGAAASTGVNEDQMRASLRQAAEIIRKNQPEARLKQRWPMRGSLLDWREMTVAEALEILSDHAANPDDPPHSASPS